MFAPSGMIHWNISWRGEKLLSFCCSDLIWLLSTVSTKASQDHTVKIKDMVFAGQARSVNDPEEDALARHLIGEKYHESEEDLDEWLESALPVAVDLVI
jgi:hypothetical protein